MSYENVNYCRYYSDEILSGLCIVAVKTIFKKKESICESIRESLTERDQCTHEQSLSRNVNLNYLDLQKGRSVQFFPIVNDVVSRSSKSDGSIPTLDKSLSRNNSPNSSLLKAQPILRSKQDISSSPSSFLSQSTEDSNETNNYDSISTVSSTSAENLTVGVEEDKQPVVECSICKSDVPTKTESVTSVYYDAVQSLTSCDVDKVGQKASDFEKQAKLIVQHVLVASRMILELNEDATQCQFKDLKSKQKPSGLELVESEIQLPENSNLFQSSSQLLRLSLFKDDFRTNRISASQPSCSQEETICPDNPTGKTKTRSSRSSPIYNPDAQKLREKTFEAQSEGAVGDTMNTPAAETMVQPTEVADTDDQVSQKVFLFHSQSLKESLNF